MPGTKKKRKNERFENTLETAPFPIYEIDYKTPRFLRVNQATCKISGYTEQELLSMDPSALLDVESAERFKDRIKRGLAGQKIDESVEFKLKAKDGHDVWTALKVKPTYKDGKLDSALVVAYDITEHKKAEEALKASESKYHSLFTNLMDGFASCQMIFDSENKPVDFVYLEINDAFERLTGLKRENIVGRKVSEAIPGTQEANPEIFEIYGRVAKTGNPERFELFFKPLSMWLDISVYSPREGYFVAVFENITERKKAEEALNSSLKQLHIAHEAAKSGIWEWNLLTGENVWSEETWRLYGLKPWSVKASYELWLETVHPKDRQRAARAVNEAAQNKTELYIEYRMSDSYGKGRWLMSRGKPLVNAEGVVDRYIGVIIDITERKKAEEALRKRKEELEQTQNRLEDKAAEVEEYATRMEELVEERTNRVKKQASLIDLSPDAIMVRGFDGTISFWSAGAEKLYGWTAQEAIGRVSHNLLKTIFPMRLTEINAQIRVTGSWSGELRHKTKDGREVIVESSWLAEKNKAGRIIDILESNVDVTERKKAEAAVQSEQKRLFDVLETMPAMVCLITPDYHIVFANRSFKERFGDSNGRRCYEYCWGQSEPCKFCESLVPLKTGKPHHWEVTGPDGSVIEAHDYPFTDIDGKQLVLEMDMDITARKKAEAQAIESARKLKDAERLAAIGATAGMVGHDIRNPLQAITSDVYLAESELENLPDGEAKKNIHESLQETEKSVDYINKIVSDLQDYARPLNPRAQESNIKTIVEETIAKQKLSPEFKVAVVIDDDAQRIIADPDYLKRIISNLVLNAIQAMPNGGRLTVKGRQDKKTDELVLTVQDAGEGIPDDVKDKLFTPMFTTKAKGQGFGLAVVKRLTEILGGTVTFESRHGKGTKFILRLPLKRNEQ